MLTANERQWLREMIREEISKVLAPAAMIVSEPKPLPLHETWTVAPGEKPGSIKLSAPPPPTVEQLKQAGFEIAPGQG